MNRLVFGLSTLAAAANFSLDAAAPVAATVEYVIVTREALAPEFQRLADWKTLEGVPAEIRTVEWIDANYPAGVDAAERVRLFLRDAYQNLGTMWVLLGGDDDVAPARYASMTFLGDDPILCDYYFMCLDGTWNADGDDLFGEEEDEVDLSPEIYAGRAPVSTQAEAAAFIDKTIAYEMAQAAGDSHPASALFLAERLFPELHGAEIGEQAAALLPPEFEVRRLYEEPHNWPGAEPLTRQATMDAVNVGFGLIHHIGSATETSWSVGDGMLTGADIDVFTNGPRYSVVFAFNAYTAGFDFEESVGEHWLTAPDGGAIACVGFSRHGFVSASTSLQQEWFRLVFQESVHSAGEATALARMPFVTQAQMEGPMRYMFFDLTLLGDPELQIRVTPGTTGVAGPLPAPAVSLLHAPAPNPFGKETEIAFDIQAGSGGSLPVELAIYDSSGRLVQKLLSGRYASGPHAAIWDGRRAGFGRAAAGVYIARLRAGDQVSTKKLVRTR
jgi:hypothetical protein